MVSQLSKYITLQQRPENMPNEIFVWSIQHTLLRGSVKGAGENRGRFKGGVKISLLWQEGSLTYCLRGGGMVWAAVCHFSMRNALALSHWIAEHCSHVQALTADVMSQTDTLVFVFLSVMLCGFWRPLFILCLPLHMVVSLSLSSDPPLLLSLGLFLWMSAVSHGGQEGTAEFGEHLQAARQCKCRLTIVISKADRYVFQSLLSLCWVHYERWEKFSVSKWLHVQCGWSGGCICL